jgi:hypothetical protein
MLWCGRRGVAPSPTIRSMIDKGMLLTRNMYLAMGWGGNVPDPWTAQHEAEVPECLHDPHAVKLLPTHRMNRDTD